MQCLSLIRYEEGMEARHLISEREVDVGTGTRETSQLPKSVETHFSWIRTRMSAERTLEAWVRTAVSLIGFGFTIVQFFERLNTTAGFKPAKDPMLTQYVGLVLIGAGILGLLGAIWQYKTLVRYLHSDKFRDISQVSELPKSATLMIAVVLCFIGLFAFIAILTRAL